MNNPTTVSGEVERVARAMYDATHMGLRNCYSWDDAWEDHQEPHRERYYKEAQAAIQALRVEPPSDVAEAKRRIEAEIEHQLAFSQPGRFATVLISDLRTMLALIGNEGVSDG
jgi:hypothetical protein